MMIMQPQKDQANWDEIAPQTLELATECLNANYYGAKTTTESLIPLLKLSDSARIVNVSSSLAALKVKNFIFFELDSLFRY